MGDYLSNSTIFKCKDSSHEMIPKELMEELNMDHRDIYKNSKNISLISKKVKDYKKESICRLPFCSTIEAEGLGALINYGDKNNGPRISSCCIKTINDMPKIKKLDLTNGRIKNVLNAINELKTSGETVCLNVSGPITIATSLMDSIFFYRELRKNNEQVLALLEAIENGIVDYILKANAVGADIFSFADPAGTIDILGPRVYRILSGKITYNILKRIENKLNNAVVHICGKTSTSLEAIGLVQPNVIELNEPACYDKILLKLVKEKLGVSFIGHSCINMNKSSKIVFLKLY